jgi:hypothetical protein
MPKPASYVQPIHFEDFDGIQFERLVFANHWRTYYTIGVRLNGTARRGVTSGATYGDFAKTKRNNRNPFVSSASTAKS